MAWRIRKSKTFGGLRLSLGRRGVSTSYGVGPFRLSLGSDRKIRRTIRLVPGVSETEVIGDLDKPEESGP